MSRGPEFSAQGWVIAAVMNRRKTIVEIEIFPGQEGWPKLLRMDEKLRTRKPTMK